MTMRTCLLIHDESISVVPVVCVVVCISGSIQNHEWFHYNFHTSAMHLMSLWGVGFVDMMMVGFLCHCQLAFWKWP